MQLISLFSAEDCAYCPLSFVSAHEALGVERIVAVEDGTVSSRQADELRRKTGDWLEIISAPVAYDLLRQKLPVPENIDRLLKSRPVLQKLFQIDAVARGAYFYFDSDVVFLRKVDLKAMENDLSSCDVIISIDPRFCCYSFGFSDVSRIRNSMYRMNSGVFVQRDEVSLCQAASEALSMSTREYLTRNWVEQSTRSQLYSTYRCKVFSEESVSEPRASVALDGQPAVVHFMGAHRKLMPHWGREDVLNNIRQSEPRKLETNTARRNGLSLYYADRIRRHLYNRYRIDLPACPASLSTR
jgi:hypothetical protein